MLTPQLGRLLRTAAADPGLHGNLRQAASYDDLARQAGAAGIDASPQDFQAAFVARDARKLSTALMEAGMMPRQPIKDAPTLEPARWRTVEELDLQPVWKQLVNRKGWEPARANLAERRYRRFLYLLSANLGLRGVPTPEIDEFWHQHILNTRKYWQDCKKLRGSYIHHLPASGEEDADEHSMMEGAYFDMWIAFESLFGEPYLEPIWDALVTRWPEALS
jgi:hypothetical protein